MFILGKITSFTFAAIFTKCPLEKIKPYQINLLNEMHLAEINTIDRISALFSQLIVESGDLRWWKEWDSGKDNYVEYDFRADLGNNAIGMGAKYCGRGPIQTTGFNNYKKASEIAFSEKRVPTNTYYLDNPEKLETPEHGFYTSILYWREKKLNYYADAQEICKISHIVNAGPWKESYDFDRKNFVHRLSKVRALNERLIAYQWAKFNLRNL